MITLDDITIVQVVVCDDARLGNDGKYILIGVNPLDTFIYERLPATQTVNWYIELRVTKAGEARTFFRMSGPSDDSGVLEGRMTIRNPEAPVILVPMTQLVTFKCAGIFRVEFSVDRENWLPVFERRIAEAGEFASGLAAATP